jgi:hypothetical protein
MSLLAKVLTSGIIDAIAPLLKPILKQVFKDYVLQAVKDANPDAYKVALSSIYGPVDVYVENLAEKTETILDDTVVDALMESIEEAAAADNITLPNLDND